MDIRKWFTSPKTTTGSQVTKGNPNVSKKHEEIKEKSKLSKKRRIISDSESDDEQKEPEKKHLSPKKRKHSEMNKNAKEKTKQKNHSPNSDDFESSLPNKKLGKFAKKPSLKLSQSTIEASDKRKPIKFTTVTDFFGCSPVERSFKKKPEKSAKPSIELNHENEDFHKTLLQLEETSKAQSCKSISENEGKETEPISHLKEKFERHLSSDIEVDPSPLEDQKVDFSAIPKEGAKKENGKSSKKKKLKTSRTEIEFVRESVEKKKKEVIKVSPATKEKKKPGGNAANYMSYLHRDGPRALGSKEIPVGEEACLQGKTFIVTGVLESITREETKELIEGHGGKLMNTLSKNTTYIVIGRDAGPSKLEKAEKLGTKQLDEDGFFELVRITPGKGPRKVKKKSPIKMEEELDAFTDAKSTIESSFVEKYVAIPTQSTKKHDSTNKVPITEILPKLPNDTDAITSKHTPTMEMWVDKYKPKSLKQIIGQQGEKSHARKLLIWLKNWSQHTKNKKPASGARWNTNDDGSGFRAALLSGPPGIGKTTTAHLVCKEAGFDFLELNASDTRSKKSLRQAVTELMVNQSLAHCLGGNTGRSVSRNHVIVMDEVDGMAGNEDRGGMQVLYRNILDNLNKFPVIECPVLLLTFSMSFQMKIHKPYSGIEELIGFIKATKVPIICICNDRNHPKIRSLSNYCFDLRFLRPRVEQIKAAMLSITFKEGLDVTANVLQDIITASNQDIRQALHNLSMWCAKEKGLSAEQAKADIGFGTKHIKMGPFDVLREVFTIGQNPKYTINDKANLFFNDYSIAPLFVQENYVHVLPTKANGNKLKHLELLSKCADSICIGDVIEKRIRSQGNWNLLPVEAIFASVIPGDVLTGHLKQMINFPAWLGKNSNRNHMDRILQELQMHMRTKITGNKTEVAMEYLPLLRRALTNPLLEREAEGIPDVLKVMQEYCLLREDFESIIELSLWSNQMDPRSKISSKVKSAFTRAYNKECSQNPFSLSTVSKKKKGSAKDSELELLGAEDVMASGEEDSEDDGKLENDAMIKMKKPTKAATAKGEATANKKDGKAAPKKGRGK